MSATVMVTYKYQIEKSIFARNLPNKILPCYHCQSWHWRSEVSLYIPYFYIIFVLHAGEIWTKLYVPNYTKLLAYKIPFFKYYFLKKRWRHFGRRFCSWNNCLNYYLEGTTIFQCTKNCGSLKRVILARLKVSLNQQIRSVSGYFGPKTKALCHVIDGEMPKWCFTCSDMSVTWQD